MSTSDRHLVFLNPTPMFQRSAALLCHSKTSAAASCTSCPESTSHRHARLFQDPRGNTKRTDQEERARRKSKRKTTRKIDKEDRPTKRKDQDRKSRRRSGDQAGETRLTRPIDRQTREQEEDARAKGKKKTQRAKGKIKRKNSTKEQEQETPRTEIRRVKAYEYLKRMRGRNGRLTLMQQLRTAVMRRWARRRSRSSRSEASYVSAL